MSLSTLQVPENALDNMKVSSSGSMHKLENYMLDLRVHKHKRGVNYVVKFSQFLGNMLRYCLHKLFLIHPEAKTQRK